MACLALYKDILTQSAHNALIEKAFVGTFNKKFVFLVA